MAQLRQARQGGMRDDSPLEDFAVKPQARAGALMTPAPPLQVSGPEAFEPKVQIPGGLPDPGGSRENQGAGTGQGPREGSVGAPQSGGAGVRSITTPKTPSPQNGGQVGLVPAPIPPPALPTLRMPNQAPPLPPSGATLSAPPSAPAPMPMPSRNAELFGGTGQAGLFGSAGGLQGGGLGVPGSIGAEQDPSALIQTLLKMLGGQ